jgi:hypothetical protein
LRHLATLLWECSPALAPGRTLAQRRPGARSSQGRRGQPVDARRDRA